MITRTTTGRRTARAVALGGVSVLVLAVACETPAPTGPADTASRPLAPEQALTEIRAMPCEPAVYLDGEEHSRGLLDTVTPDDIETVDVIRTANDGCGAVLILTRDATPEGLERHRRVREQLMAASQAASRAAVEDLAEGPTFTPMTVRPSLTNAPQVVQALRENYPPLLRDAGVTGTASVWLLIDDDGAVRQKLLHESSGHDALDQAALRVADTMEFAPAYNRDVRVPVWIALPVTFETQQAPARAPEPEAERGRGERPTADGPTFTPMTVRPGLRNQPVVRNAIAAHYPPLLRDVGIGGTVRVWVLIDETGAVQQAQISQGSGHDALDEAALRVAPIMEFTPAHNRDDPVRVWVVVPITFP